MSDPAIISAVYTEWKMVKTRSALILCFEVPLEQQAMVQEALGTPLADQSIHVAIARLKPQTAAVEAPMAPDTLPAPRKPAKMSQIAGILCNEPAFWRFLADRFTTDAIVNPEDAAYALRHICGIESRRELDFCGPHEVFFRNLESDYRLWLRGIE